MKCHINDCIDCSFSDFCKEGKITTLKEFEDIRRQLYAIDFETLALRAGLKKIVKKEFFTKKQYEDYLKSNQDLYIGLSNDNPEAMEQGLIGFIASTDEKLTKRGNYLENNMYEALIKKDFGLYREMGNLLGYPSCCVDRFANISYARRFAKVSPGKIDTGFDILALKSTKEFLCPLLKATSNELLSYLPCSFDCINSISFIQNVISLAGEECNLDLYLLFGFLKSPSIYFTIDFHLDIVGYLDEGKIRYFSYLPSSKAMSKFDILGKGNTMFLSNNLLSIYNDDEFIINIEVKNFLLLNFGHNKECSLLGELDRDIRKFF